MDVSGVFKAYHEKKLVFETKINVKFKGYLCGEEFCITLPDGHKSFIFDSFEIFAEGELISKRVFRTGAINKSEHTILTLTTRITASEGWEPKESSRW